MGSDFNSIETGVSGIKRYWALLYVFKFYNSDDIFFYCTVIVCPNGSSSCDIVSTCIQFEQKVSMARKCKNHSLQTNQCHREEETKNNKSHVIKKKVKIKQQLSLPIQDDC